MKGNDDVFQFGNQLLLLLLREARRISGSRPAICSCRYFSGSFRICSRLPFIRSRLRAPRRYLDASGRWSMAMVKPTARPRALLSQRQREEPGHDRFPGARIIRQEEPDTRKFLGSSHRPPQADAGAESMRAMESEKYGSYHRPNEHIDFRCRAMAKYCHAVPPSNLPRWGRQWP